MKADRPENHPLQPTKTQEMKCVKCIHPHSGAEPDTKLSFQAHGCGFFENTGVPTIIVEADMTISMANGHVAEIFGYSKDELAGTCFLDYLTAEYRDMARVYHELVFGGQVEPKPFECRLYDKGDVVREVTAQIGWVAESRQAIISLVDLSESKKAERERHSLTEIVEQSSESVLLTDAHGNIVYVNAAFEFLSGYDREEMIGQTVAHPFFSEQDTLALKKMSFSVRCNEASESRTRNLGKDGIQIITATRMAPICDIKGRVINLVCTKKNITRETELEQQLHHSQKMEAIGTMASGIAHDFNNILSGIMGYAEMAASDIAAEARAQRYISRIIQACGRAKDLAGQILAFSSKKKQEQLPVEIQSLIKEALNLLRASIPATVKIRKSLPSEPCRVMADPTQIHQIILNLCANAAQAMEGKGGEMEIVLENARPAPSG